MSRRKSPKSTIKKVVISDGTIIFSSLPRRLEDVPLEYQASLYAKKQRFGIVKADAKKKRNLDGLKAHLKVLKERLRNAAVTSAKEALRKEILALEKAIKKAPKPKRKWSPVLS